MPRSSRTPRGEPQRLQKIIAHAGIASRRAAEGLIASGRVRVNGRIVTELGASADPVRDRIEVDGRRVVIERPVYYVLHKPRGMVSTLRDPEGRPHIGELLADLGARVYPVGRLDFHTSGVLLVTNDGELTQALLHPRRDVPKTYVAKVRGHVPLEALERLRKGVVLDDGTKTKPADVWVFREGERHTWLQITLYEGKNRQIHRMSEAVGHPVLRLARTSFAGMTVEGLRPGELRALTDKEVETLKKTYLVPKRKAGGRSLEQREDRMPAEFGRPASASRGPGTSDPHDARPGPSRGPGDR